MKKGLLLSIIIMMLACLALPALAAKASTPGNQGVSHPEEIEDGGWSAPENSPPWNGQTPICWAVRSGW